MPLIILVPVLLDTVVARPVNSCPRQHQLPVQVVRLALMDLLLTTTTPVVLIVVLANSTIIPAKLNAKSARLGNTKKNKDK